jgi:hypothetical protein
MRNKQAKQMIESISKPKDLYGVVMLDLPWIEHPYAGMYFDGSNGRDCRILRKVSKLVSFRKMDYITGVMEDSDHTYDFNITHSCGGERQEGYFVNQTENGGITGDSYAGQIWIPISPKRYLTFQYAM